MTKPDRYLQKRGHSWYYYRRVPAKFASFDDRGTIRLALGTTSLDQARLRRDQLAVADDEYWASLALVEAGSVDGQALSRPVAERRYRAACALALASGFTYRPMEALLDEGRIESIVERVLAVSGQRTNDGAIRPARAEALLGAAPTPQVTISDAFDVYVSDIAIDEQFNKSDQQKYQWQKVKRRSLAYFVEVVGDLPLADITRDHALAFKNYWSERMRDGPNGKATATPNTANRHIGNVRTVYSAYFKHVGEEERPNPFRNIFFKGKTRTEVPAFDDDWVRTRILRPGVFSGLNRQLQLIIHMLIETGCRPSEIINLEPGDIRLDEQVPFISIRPKQKREIKTESSIRDIPLVGVSLEAARLAPKGFPHYRDRNELLSANLMKAFRRRDLFPSEDHRIYSFRHAFEKRMQEANIDWGLRCLLMGHQTNRPAYGDGGSMAYRRDELLRIVHPVPPGLFRHLADG